MNFKALTLATIAALCAQTEQAVQFPRAGSFLSEERPFQGGRNEHRGFSTPMFPENRFDQSDFFDEDEPSKPQGPPRRPHIFVPQPIIREDPIF